MSIAPIITFKAGFCDADFSTSPPKIKPKAQPGFLYLYNEEELVHFCWRPRNESLANPTLDLVMVPTDGTFQPYLGETKISNKSPVQGRIFVLKFSSSSQRYFFWLQSREQPPGQPSQFSPRDIRLGQIVDNLLQGNDVDTTSEIESLRNHRPSGGDNDETMEDAPPPDHPDPTNDKSGSGAAADGEQGDQSAAGPGSSDASLRDQTNEAVRNFLESLKSSGTGTSQGKLFTTLAELLPASSTLPMIEEADPETVENLLVNHLPSSLVFLEHEVDDVPDAQADPDTLRASVQALDPEQQKGILRKVLRSPQFFQGLMSLTSALRDGGLPMVSEALGVEVPNGGYTGPDRRVPVSGGDAVEIFLQALKRHVESSENQ